ncbi:MAG TPA: IS21 family transposase, partial [Thermoanaerobaculia bacterium]|nr:IS21 family transposase [Thermoanaerobaculia bacterium]
MLRMDQVHVIRHKVLVEGHSARSVARQLGVSRNTVRKYLRLSAPVRVERHPRARPVLDRVRSRIAALLDEWRLRTTAKQRVTGSRLHRQ